MTERFGHLWFNVSWSRCKIIQINKNMICSHEQSNSQRCCRHGDNRHMMHVKRHLRHQSDVWCCSVTLRRWTPAKTCWLYKHGCELYSKGYFSVLITSLSSSCSLLWATKRRLEWGIELAARREIGRWREDTFADVRLPAARTGFCVCVLDFKALIWSNLQQTKCRSLSTLPLPF